MCQWKLFLLVLASVVAVWLISTSIANDESFKLKDWIALVFFLAGGIRVLSLMMAGEASLRLDRDGLEMPGFLIEHVRLRWTDIESIRLSWFRSAILIRYRDARYRRRLSIPNLYEAAINELFEKMNEWHARHGYAV